MQAEYPNGETKLEFFKAGAPAPWAAKEARAMAFAAAQQEMERGAAKVTVFRDRRESKSRRRMAKESRRRNRN